jgi:hypothetical protein
MRWGARGEGLAHGEPRQARIGVAAQVVLGQGDEDERKLEPARRLDGCRDALDCVVEPVERAFGVPVLDRAAGDSRRG